LALPINMVLSFLIDRCRSCVAAGLIWHKPGLINNYSTELTRPNPVTENIPECCSLYWLRNCTLCYQRTKVLQVWTANQSGEMSHKEECLLLFTLYDVLKCWMKGVKKHTHMKKHLYQGEEKNCTKKFNVGIWNVKESNIAVKVINIPALPSFVLGWTRGNWEEGKGSKSLHRGPWVQ
jgi:hypothetical protein